MSSSSDANGNRRSLRDAGILIIGMAALLSVGSLLYHPERLHVSVSNQGLQYEAFNRPWLRKEGLQRLVCVERGFLNPTLAEVRTTSLRSVFSVYRETDPPGEFSRVEKLCYELKLEADRNARN